jgi:hypothetical protein
VVIALPVKAQSEPPVGVWSTPLNVIDAPEDTVNPDPVTVYVAPTGPWVGLAIIAGVVTLNVPVAV